jgi:hypothetical protein
VHAPRETGHLRDVSQQHQLCTHDRSTVQHCETAVLAGEGQGGEGLKEDFPALLNLGNGVAHILVGIESESFFE